MKTNYVLHQMNGHPIVAVREQGIIVNDANEFLDLVMNLPADRVVLHQENFTELFFDLRSGVAGEILQKASTYSRRLGIVGDFSRYGSKSLRDFIGESNRFGKVVFVNSLDEALQKLSA
jgi:hypothetical protein